MNPKLKEKLMESLTAVLPITLIVLALSVVLVPMDVGTAVMFTVGAVLLVFGMGLFQLGAEMAMSPLGEGIGVQMERVKKIPVIVAIAFVMGVIITIASRICRCLPSRCRPFRIRCLFIRLPSAWARFWRWRSCAF